MTDEQEYISDSLHQKLPAQHWVLRYSSLLVGALIALLLIGLYWIKIPQFINIELHPIAESDQFKATTDLQHHELFRLGQVVEIQLENGHQTSFRVQAAQSTITYLHLQLVPLELNKQDRDFLYQEYMSIGKIKKCTSPLIYSLINT